jgi:hypothetical protein
VAGELHDAGTVANDVVTYTSQPRDRQDTHLSTIAINYADSNQPIVAGDLLGLEFYRDVSADNYSGTAYALAIWIEYNSIEMGR